MLSDFVPYEKVLHGKGFGGYVSLGNGGSEAELFYLTARLLRVFCSFPHSLNTY